MKPIHNLRFAFALSAAAVGWFAGGCATYRVKVDSICRSSSPTGNRTSYTLLNKNPAVETDSLRYREAVQRIKTALSSRGLWEAHDAATADMIVEFDYAIEPAHVVYKEAELPVYVPRCPIVGQMAGRELVGLEKSAIPTIVCEKHLSVSCRAVDLGTEGRPPPELWWVSASIEDQRSNLRECLPVLAAAVMEQIGKTTNGLITTQVRQDDPAIAFINKGT